MTGSRITDAIEYYGRRGQVGGAVRVVRRRDPDKFRWRRAVGALTYAAGKRKGLDRARLEEPVREVVLDLADPILRREVVLDARRARVDLDRGEVLPFRTVGDLRRITFLTGTDMDVLRHFVAIGMDFEAPLDTAGVVLVGRAIAEQHRRRAHRASLELPDADVEVTRGDVVRTLREQARRDVEDARRWRAVADALLREVD